jgi:hypothetical protein
MRVAKQTLLQFPPPRSVDLSLAPDQSSPRATACGTCGQHIPPATGFCMHCAQELAPATNWGPLKDLPTEPADPAPSVVADKAEAEAPSYAELDLAFSSVARPSQPLWLKLAVIATALLASIGFAFAFRPKRGVPEPIAPTAATATRLSVGADAMRREPDELVPSVVGDAGTPVASEASVVPTVAHPTPGLTGPTRVIHAEPRAKPLSRSGLAKRFTRREIVDPWAK